MHLYIDSQGFEKTNHSHSGGDRFRYCPELYRLERIVGWHENVQKAAPLYGVAIENAIRFYHENDLKGGVGRFVQEWEQHRPQPDQPDHKNNAIVYNRDEKDWKSLLESGQEHLRLYDILYPKMPFSIVNPSKSFQLRYVKEVFPDTKWAGIEFVAYLDVIARLKPDGRRLLLDLKATGKRVKAQPGIIALDRQLQSYTWISGISDVGLCCFEKHSRSMKTGYTVRLLANAGKYSAGDKLLVAGNVPDMLDTIFVVDRETLEYANTTWPSAKKADTTAWQSYIEMAAETISTSNVTKQDLAVYLGQVDERDARQTGQQIGYDIAAIINAQEQNFYPRLGGVRFPNEKCPSCPMLGNCTGDNVLRDKLVHLSMEDFDTKYEREEE